MYYEEVQCLNAVNHFHILIREREQNCLFRQTSIRSNHLYMSSFPKSPYTGLTFTMHTFIDPGFTGPICSELTCTGLTAPGLGLFKGDFFNQTKGQINYLGSNLNQTKAQIKYLDSSLMFYQIKGFLE
jgi:hypothetical protein